MADDGLKLEQLRQRLLALEQRQLQLTNDLKAVKDEMLRLAEQQEEMTEQPFLATEQSEVSVVTEGKELAPRKVDNGSHVTDEPSQEAKPVARVAWEEFIGTNLLNKIGIAVLVLGIGIGAKYAIDHDLISPLTRIVLGYVSGIALLGIAIRLKARYENFSAVLLSGGMAVLYFITFAAFDFYQLIPREVAFGLMFLFTVFTVFAALQYNLQVIAVIGLVGSYAVPFLLSDGSGRVVVLFAYMSVINAGILFLSFRRSWKVLFSTAFVLTWMIYAGWMTSSYDAEKHLVPALAFGGIFFVIFYFAFLSEKIFRQLPLTRWDIVVLLVNSFIFFGYGYFAIDEHREGASFLGIFTVANALVHFVACAVLYRLQQSSRDAFFFIAGLVLTFITLAVPVQLNGNWVTLIWAGEATVLFWIGRTKRFPVYERLSYVLVVLCFLSLVQDWNDFYTPYYRDDATNHIPFINIQFLSSILVCACLGYMVWVQHRFKINDDKPSRWVNIFAWAVPALLLITVYFTFYKEVEYYWNQRYVDSEMAMGKDADEYMQYDRNLLHLRSAWLIIYSGIFLVALSIVNIKKITNDYLQVVLALLSVLTITYFVFDGLENLSLLRSAFLNPHEYYRSSLGNVLVRYVVFAAVVPLLWVVTSTAKRYGHQWSKASILFSHLVILVMLSSELVNVLELSAVEYSNRLSLFILWGAYALGLIVYGLAKEVAYLRISAIVIFGITLIKVFFYDLAAMSTISKTLVMVILGVLLLIASFLYNKFKKNAV